MKIIAIVLRINPRNLLVRDVSNNQEVLVHFHNTRQFAIGDRVRIYFNGQMTFSIPPQITATSIQKIRVDPPQPAQMRAIVLQIGRGCLMVWDLHGNRLIHVEFSNVNRFRAGQKVIIRYDTITLDTPPHITATSIIPI